MWWLKTIKIELASRMGVMDTARELFPPSRCTFSASWRAFTDEIRYCITCLFIINVEFVCVGKSGKDDMSVIVVITRNRYSEVVHKVHFPKFPKVRQCRKRFARGT